MIQTLLNRLDKVTPKGTNAWMARCPAHDDRTPSLAIKHISDGRILIKCFAGCEPTEILSSIGMTMSDLFPGGCLGELKGWDRLRQELGEIDEKKKQEQIVADEIFLAVCDAAREAGKKLTKKELDKEQECYRRHRAYTNG